MLLIYLNHRLLYYLCIYFIYLKYTYIILLIYVYAYMKEKEEGWNGGEKNNFNGETFWLEKVEETVNGVKEVKFWN